MEIENYYDEFLNKEYSTRQFRSINISNGFVDSMTSRNPTITKKRVIKSKDNFNCKLYYGIGFMKDGVNYHDRLFFDFDLDNKEYKDLKTSSDARDMLFNSDILETPFNEVSMLHDFLKGEGFKSYVDFSGSKGFHLYCFFEPIPMGHHERVSRRFADLFVENLNLKTLDFKIFTKNRNSRLPYGRHEKTDLYTVPCDVNSEIQDILYESLNPTIQDFKMSDYIVKGFSDELKQTDEIISKMFEKEANIKKRKIELKRESQKDVIYHKSIDFSTIDMRQLVRNVASDYFVKSMSNYDIYLCPFHSDAHHSAYCYEKRFGCASCGKSWNYYDFIADYYDLTDPKEIMDVIKSLQN